MNSRLRKGLLDDLAPEVALCISGDLVHGQKRSALFTSNFVQLLPYELHIFEDLGLDHRVRKYAFFTWNLTINLARKNALWHHHIKTECMFQDYSFTLTLPFCPFPGRFKSRPSWADCVRAEN
jgi:hypothetical protein